jgi:hypothetical protein
MEQGRLNLVIVLGIKRLFVLGAVGKDWVVMPMWVADAERKLGVEGWASEW